MKENFLFGLYTGWNPTQYKKDYKKPYNQGNRTVSNQDFMEDVAKVFSFPKCTKPTGLACWIANTLEDWNSWTPLSQTLSSSLSKLLLIFLLEVQGWHRVPGRSYFFGRVILCGSKWIFWGLILALIAVLTDYVLIHHGIWLMTFIVPCHCFPVFGRPGILAAGHV